MSVPPAMKAASATRSRCSGTLVSMPSMTSSLNAFYMRFSAAWRVSAWQMSLPISES